MALTTLSKQTMTITTEELDALEAKVRTGLSSFVEVGNVLLEIRDRGGYQRRGYKTFEAYCEREFGITDRHGRRLIVGAETAHKVELALGPGHTPKNEGVARELEKVADDPVVLGKVQARLSKMGKGGKALSIATATAEKVAEVVAAVTGRTRPAKAEKAKPAPKPNGHAAATPPELGTDSITSLQATLTSARTFLSTHPWFKEDADAGAIVKQLDTARALLEGLLANAYAARAGARPARPGGKAEVGGPPRCPSCRQAISPGEVFCSNCGSAL
jgi:acetylornithine deacetylase/succinyl-diaminopimelate desuccinylase-like protein